MSAQNFVWNLGIGGKKLDAGAIVAIDTAGNICVLGNFSDTVDFDPGVGISNLVGVGGFMGNGNGDAFICKYNPFGILIWAKKIGGPYQLNPTGLSFDPSGNVLITGHFIGSIDLDPGNGTAIFSTWSSIYRDCFILKLDTAGNYVWGGTTGGGNGNCVSTCLTVNRYGEVLYGGFYSNKGGAFDLDPWPNTYFWGPSFPNGNNEAYITKLDGSGHHIWTKFIGNTPNVDEGISSISTDSIGGIYISGGYSIGTDLDPGPGVYTLTASGWAIFISKLDSAGNFVWAKSFDSQGDEFSYSIEADRFGNTYMTGAFRDTIDLDPGIGIYTVSPSGSDDFFISKLDPSGNYIWSKVFQSPNFEHAVDLTLDKSKNVYATGIFNNSLELNPGPGNTIVSNTGFLSSFIIKLDSSGIFKWGKSIPCIDSSSKNTTGSLCIDKQDNLYLTGGFSGTVDFDPDAGQNYLMDKGGPGDMFLLKLGACIPLLKTSLNQTICIGESTRLFASGAYSYTWLPVGYNSPIIVINPIQNMTYTVVGSKSFDCLGYNEISVHVDICASLSENSNSKNPFLVYPNPNSGDFILNYTEDLNIRLVSELGKILQTIQLDDNNNFKATVSHLEAGLYFLSSEKGTQKVVVLK